MIVEFCDVGMVELVHDFHFCFHVIEKILSFEGLLFDLFDGVDGPCFFVSGFPDGSIGALAQCFEILEIHFEGLDFPPGLNGG